MIEYLLIDDKEVVVVPNSLVLTLGSKTRLSPYDDGKGDKGFVRIKKVDIYGKPEPVYHTISFELYVTPENSVLMKYLNKNNGKLKISVCGDVMGNHKNITPILTNGKQEGDQPTVFGHGVETTTLTFRGVAHNET